jgi:hypothetical protein
MNDKKSQDGKFIAEVFLTVLFVATLVFTFYIVFRS